MVDQSLRRSMVYQGSKALPGQMMGADLRRRSTQRESLSRIQEHQKFERAAQSYNFGSDYTLTDFGEGLPNGRQVELKLLLQLFEGHIALERI